MSLINTVFFQTIFAFSVKVLAGGASYFLFMIFAQYLGTENFGDFSFYFSVITLFGIVGNFGQQIFLVKEIPKARLSTTCYEENHIYSFTKKVTLFSSFFTAVVFLLFSFINEGGILNFIGVWGALLVMFYSWSQTSIGALRIQDRTLFALFTRDLAWRCLSIVAIALYSFFLGRILSTHEALMILTVTLVPFLGIHLFALRSNINILNVNKAPKSCNKKWLENSFGLAMISLISSADSYIYTIILGYISSAQEVGGSFAAFKTVEFLNLFLMAVTLIVSPKLSEMAAMNDVEGLQRKCNVAIILQSVPVIFSFFIIMLFADQIMLLFNESFAQYAPLLKVLAVGMVVNALTGATGLLLQIGNMHWEHVVYQGVAILLAALLLPLFVHLFGVVGVGYSFILSKVLWNILAIRAIKRNLKIDPSIFAFLSPKRRYFSSLKRDLFRP
tara:strand:- start:4587 stop:5921 length:1335 start_codon:yes stop_codon:yes gene_type:complete